VQTNAVAVKLLTRIEDMSCPATRDIQAILSLYEILGPLLEVRSYARRIRSTEGISLNWGSLHAKLVIADTERAYIGSAEPRGYALNGNFEVGLVSAEPATTSTLLQVFDAVWELADAVTQSYCRRFISR